MSSRNTALKLKKLGRNISRPNVEVLNVSSNGLWLLVQEKEYFLPYEKFPWFKNAKITDITNIRLLHGFHLNWPKLDVDLELASLGNLENYPLVYR